VKSKIYRNQNKIELVAIVLLVNDNLEDSKFCAHGKIVSISSPYRMFF
jgi:hypothetical protein